MSVGSSESETSQPKQASAGDDNTSSSLAVGKRKRTVKFPEKLHQLLEAAAAAAAAASTSGVQTDKNLNDDSAQGHADSPSESHSTAIEWHPSGDSFLITDQEGLCASPLFRQFFPHQSKPRSFERILLTWGFSRWPYQEDSSRISRHGAADSIPFRFGHDQFRRGKLEELRAIQRIPVGTENNSKPTKKKASKKRSAASTASASSSQEGSFENLEESSRTIPSQLAATSPQQEIAIVHQGPRPRQQLQHQRSRSQPENSTNQNQAASHASLGFGTIVDGGPVTGMSTRALIPQRQLQQGLLNEQPVGWNRYPRSHREGSRPIGGSDSVFWK